jgi:hypothetical protein
VVPPSNPPAIPKPTDLGAGVGQIWDQLLVRWDMLGGRTLVEAVAAIGAALKISGFTDPHD